MARTAPIPNFPAIPGMNPGVWIMGGGAGGGGPGGKGGDGTADGQGGDGANGGQDAEGGGKGAGACGPGENGACTNCGHTIARGDPVDVSTGRAFTVPKRDLFLPGLFNLSILRSYSTARREVDVGMGFGWTHSLAWTLEERRASVVVRTGDGRLVELPRPREPGDEARLGPWGVLRGENEYLIRPGNEFIHVFRPVELGAKQHLLASISFRGRGRISLQHEDGRLARIVDTVGRIVLLERTKEGRVERISVPEPRGRNLVFARYAYDAEGNLIAVADADGHTTRFAYDDEHRLTRLEYPSGILFHFVYDESGRCVETWGACSSGSDPALAGGLPELLVDGRTRARGIYHCRFEYGDDYTEVVDSVRLQRFTVGPSGKIATAVDARGGVTARDFDELGRVTSQADPTGATWSYAYDELDQIVRETDPEGHQISISRDGAGRPVEIVDAAGGAVKLTRNEAGELDEVQDQNGGVTRFMLDARSLVTGVVDPRGGRRHYEYDAHGNLITYTTATGGRYRFTYDYWGRRLSEQDPRGNVCWFSYTDAGLVSSVVDGRGRRTTYDYDSMGNAIRTVRPDGTSESAAYGGLNWLCRLVRADGAEVRVLRNREGWPVLVQNELGERYEFEYGRSGLVTAERDFLGRVTRYGHDPLGRITWVDEGDGKQKIKRNRRGEIIEEVAPDGAVRTYEYNARGELVQAASDAVSFTWLRDATGKILREELRVGGVVYVVETKRNRAGDSEAVRTSLGHELALRRDAAGALTEIWERNERVLAIRRNEVGMSACREFSGGGALLLAYDEENNVKSQKVTGPGAPRPSTGEPAWVGRDGRGGLERSYDYTPVDEILKVTSSDGRDVEYAYDVRRRVSMVKTTDTTQTFAADSAGNCYEVGPRAPSRSHGEGGQLLAMGDISYRYDGRGRLIEKRRAASGQSAEEITRFEWNAWGLLSAVVSPDGTRSEFEYDAFARRLEKRIIRNGTILDRHHYVWDLLSMVHDVKVDDRGKVERAQTFLFEDNRDPNPVGHWSGNEWIHYVSAPNGAPLDLVDPTGKRVGALERALFGRTKATGEGAATPFRFLGQVEDHETGLHYNRYRYYDPDAGRYISPDPISLAGGLHLYAYGKNPVSWVDPMGWEPHFTTVTGFPSEDATHATSKSPVKYDSKCSANCPVELSHPSGALSHSEQKWCFDLLASGKKGGTYKLEGSLPPCPNCHGAMMRTAKETGSEITYDWGDGNSITYDGKTNPGTVGVQFSEGDSASFLSKSGYKDFKLTDDWNPQKGKQYKSAPDYWGIEKGKGSHWYGYTPSKNL